MAEQPSTPALPPGEYPPLRGTALVFLTIAIGLSSFMEILDMTIVNVSIPSIAGSLGVSPSEGTWSISSYLMAAAVVQPLAGWIGRRFGEVRTFVVSNLLFIVFSAICGLATSMPMLIAARLMQGLVSGPMMSVAQALLLRNYPVHLRGLALGLWAMVVIVAPIIGPVLGGWITDNLSWPWLFYINVPGGLFAAGATWMMLRRRESARLKVPVDVVGLALLVIGVGALQFMLDNGNEKDWFHSGEILAAAVTGVVAISFLIPWELTDKHPIIDLHLFARRNFRVGTVSVAIAYFAFTGVNVIFPLWLQTALGYTSTWAGWAMAPIGLMALVLAPVIGRNLYRINLRAAPTLAFVVQCFALTWIAGQTAEISFGQMALPRFIMGFGLPLFFLPLNQIIMSGIPASELASAAGLSNFVRTFSGSIATAVTVFFWNNRSEYHYARLAEHVTPDSPAWAAYQSQLQALGIQGNAAYATTSQIINGQALTLGANDLFMMLAALFVVLVPFVWLAKPPFRAVGTGSAH
ncbi:MAG TPA: DHA2 family efflux MFS transporter permease subunit [Steroidobacteraceae bacterium]|nr:DHA2 family efflux MFS transporter permease subunit [Steroidobacteraceae bacterium]